MSRQRSFHISSDRAPSAHTSTTSTEAAAAIVRSGKHGRLKALVMHFLTHSHGGLTDEEIEALIDGVGAWCRLTSVVSTRNSLCNHKPPLVEDSGMRRLSPASGMRVTVWRVK